MKKILMVLFLSVVFLPHQSSAHGVVTTLTQNSGPYTLEFEYSGLNNLKAGDLALLDVYFLDASRNPIDFDSVFLKIVDANNASVFYGTFKEASDIPGTARMGTIFKDPGDYKVQVQFNRSGQLYSANYDLKIDPGLGNNDNSELNRRLTTGTSTIILEIILLVGGFVLGLAIRSLIKYKSKK